MIGEKVRGDTVWNTEYQKVKDLQEPTNPELGTFSDDRLMGLLESQSVT